MAFPEKVARNERIYFLHLNKLSYRAIQVKEGLTSVKSVYVVVERMRRRHPDVAKFLADYQVWISLQNVD